MKSSKDDLDKVSQMKSHKHAGQRRYIEMGLVALL